jgi:uncharacterized protein DUF3306
MTIKRAERFSLGRWSRRKLSAARAAPAAEAAPLAPAPAAPGASAPVELPPVDSLTFDSDFTVFLRPEVDADLKRAALKQLFRDPRFNVMDGLDVYIDDYTKADPIPEDMLADLLQRFARTEPDAVAVPATQPQADAGRDAAAGEAPPAAEAGAATREEASPATSEAQRAPTAPGDPAALEPPAKPGAKR